MRRLRLSSRTALALALVVGIGVGIGVGVGAAPAAAQRHPTLERGYAAAKAFEINQLDDVNLFTGNVVLTLPVGPTFKVGGRLSYGLTLVSNTKAWEFRSRIDTNQTFTQALVDRRKMNVAFGWQLLLGGLLLPPQSPSNPSMKWVLITQDGAEHAFYPVLHESERNQAGEHIVGIHYTRDGSYLRLRELAQAVEVDFPDGRILRFGRSDGRIQEIRDRFGNDVRVTWSGDDWTVTDSVLVEGQRRTTFRVKTKATGIANALSLARVVESVTVPVWSASNPDATAAYTLTTTNTPIPYDCLHDDPLFPEAQQITVPLLTAVNLPNGTSYALPAADYVTTGCETAGLPKKLILPTLGRIEWTYRRYVYMLAFSEGRPEDLPRPITAGSPGVATRKLVDPDGTVHGTWSYDTQIGPVVQIDSRRAAVRRLTNTVTDPEGHRVERAFSVYPWDREASDPAGWSIADFGLALDRDVTDGTTAARHRASRTYHRDGRLLRTEHVRYEHDLAPSRAVDPDEPARYDLNRREMSSRTVFHDDNDRFAETNREDFDGLGHYRRTVLRGFNATAPARTVETAYNPGRGTYLPDAAGGSFVLPPTTGPWMLEGMAHRSVMDGGGAREATLYCFDPATGFVLRERRLKNGDLTPHANDVLVVYTPTADGHVAREDYSGGDVQEILPPEGTTVCSMNPPTSQYSLVHTYAAGELATSQFAGTTYKTVDRTLHLPTGLVQTSADSAGIVTSFEYDTLGRLVWEKPQADTDPWIEHAYSNAAAGPSSAEGLPWTPARVRVTARPNGSPGGAALAQSEVVADPFGRLFRDRMLMPGSVWGTRETRHNALGWVAEVSERAATPSHFTRYLDFDPFGRPARIVPPEGAAHQVELAYGGIRTVVRTVKVGTTFAPPLADATTIEVYDRLGRLVRVDEPSGAGGAVVQTSYAYDQGDRLTAVTSSAGAQARAFGYDRRGFLLSESHPEKGAAVTYSGYDGRGLAGRKVDGASDLSFVYDAAGRLEGVWETGGRVLKEFAYGTSNADRSNGKLVTARRHNYQGSADARLTTGLSYGGRGGRVSGRTLQLAFNGTPAESFSQSFLYNQLGQVREVGYPLCTHAGCQTPPALFADVEAEDPRLEIEAIARAGVTAGCGGMPPNFCPDGKHTRAQMAVFLLRAKEGPAYTPPPCDMPTFADVPCSDPFAPWINELAERGITGGCGNSNFCPNGTVSQGQMAVFLLATREGLGYQPPPCTAAPFDDVACSAPFAAWIAELKRRGIADGCGGTPPDYCPDAAVTRAQMAVLLTRTFGFEVWPDPKLDRRVELTYGAGHLTGLTGYGSVSYHRNGMVHQVSHANGVADTWTLDPHGLRRPAEIASALGGAGLWTTGGYSYDGAGNVTRMGNAWFLYDKVSRLTTANLVLGPQNGGAQRQQTYTFDAFGNLTAIAGHSGRTIPVDPATNRLNGAGTSYDTAGNLKTWNGAQYDYDAFHQMTRMKNGAEEWLYAYDAEDERAWMFKVGANRSHWTLRGLDGEVLREYVNDAGRWRVEQDYVYRDGQLLAAEGTRGRRHFHLDHLGTPRLITNRAGYPVAYHVYYPFGEEATAFNQDGERMKFTGHERDLANPAGPGDDLDSMHARHFSPVTGRFLSVDRGATRPRIPQMWNRYSYALGNPLKFVDPDGNVVDTIFDIGSILYDLFDIGRSLYRGEGVEKVQLLALGADVGGTFVPGATGAGITVRLANKADDLVAVSRVGELSKTLSNIFENNLTVATAEAAARESLGEVVARKATGQAYDHILKYSQAREGAVRAIENLKRITSDQRLSNAERSAAEVLLKKYSRQLDSVEEAYNKALAKARLQ